MGNKLTASVVGCGVGGRLSIGSLANSQYFDLKAISDLDPTVLKELQTEDIQTFTDYREMFEKCPTDVVCVSTFPNTHEEVTKAALDLSLKGILVEKPLAHNVESARRILDSIIEKKIPVAVPHGLIARPAQREIINQIRKGAIGDLELVEIQNNKWDIMSAGIHWIQFFLYLSVEEIDYVMSTCESSSRTYRDGIQVETTGVTYVQTKKGTRLVMNTGDNVKINIEGAKMVYKLIGSRGQIHFWGDGDLFYIQNKEYPSGRIIQSKPPETFPHQWYLDNMAGMISTGKPDYHIPETSLRALKICEAAYLSSKYQCKVTFPYEDFKLPEKSNWDPGSPYSGTGGGRDGRKLD